MPLKLKELALARDYGSTRVHVPFEIRTHLARHLVHLLFILVIRHELEIVLLIGDEGSVSQQFQESFVDEFVIEH